MLGILNYLNVENSLNEFMNNEQFEYFHDSSAAKMQINKSILREK